MRKNQKGLAHIGIILALVVIVFVGWVAVLVVNHNRHEKQAKADLDTSFAAIKAPPGCVEDRRYYVKPGIDTRSSWNIYYNCSVDVDTVYSELKSTAKSGNQTISIDRSTNVFHSQKLFSANLTILNNGYESRYYLEKKDKTPDIKSDIWLEFLKS